jgi:hypothetical protein
LTYPLEIAKSHISIRPRKARVDAPGALQHIICRGIERRKIFWTDDDRDDFLQRLATVLVETQTPCYAWALMYEDTIFKPLFDEWVRCWV